MAIKIKREVNPAAAAYASAAGGRGKRQSEDAKLLASLAGGGGLGGGGSGGGARASANAQIMSAPSGGGSAPLGSLPSPASAPSSGRTSFGPTSSPGGRKKGYLGSTSARGTMGDDAMANFKMFQGGSAKNPFYELRDAAGNTIKRYSAGEYKSLVKRGAAGSTMNREDSAAYFRGQGGQTAEEKAAAIRKEEQEFKEAEAQKNRDATAANQKSSQGFQAAENQKQREAADARQKAEQRWRAEEAEKHRQAELAAERRAQQRKSYAEQGYSQEQILKLEDNDRKVLEINNDPRASQEQKDAALTEAEEERGKIGDPAKPPKSLQEEFDEGIVTDPESGIRYRKNSRGEFEPIQEAPAAPKSAKEIWDSSFEGPDGGRYIADGKGGLKQIYAPPKADTHRADTIWKRIGELEAEHNKAIEEGKKPNGTPFDREAAIKKIGADYDAVYETSMTAGNKPQTQNGGVRVPQKPLSMGVAAYSDSAPGEGAVWGMSPQGEGKSPPEGRVGSDPVQKSFLPEGRVGTKFYEQIPQETMDEFRRLYPNADGWSVISGDYDKQLSAVAKKIRDFNTVGRIGAEVRRRNIVDLPDARKAIAQGRAEREANTKAAYLEELLAAQKEAEDEAFRIGVEKGYDDEAVKRTVAGLMDSQYAKLYRKYKITSDEGRRLLKNQNK